MEIIFKYYSFSNSKYSNVIQSVQEVGNCFTLFRHSNNTFLANVAIKSGLSQSPVIQGVEEALNLDVADQPFNPNEVFRMMINFSVNEYTTLNDKISGHLMIHDSNELPPINEKNFFIHPGYYYEIYVSKQTGKYLPKPYITDCVLYNDQHSGDVEEGGRRSTKFIPSVLTRETCIMNCMATKTIDLCQCWPPELPFIVADSGNGTAQHQYKWCSWRDGVNIRPRVNKTDNLSWFGFCFANNEKDCNKKCKKQCV